MYRVKKWWIHGDSSLFNKIFNEILNISNNLKKPHKLFGESKIDCCNLCEWRRRHYFPNIKTKFSLIKTFIIMQGFIPEAGWISWSNLKKFLKLKLFLKLKNFVFLWEKKIVFYNFWYLKSIFTFFHIKWLSVSEKKKNSNKRFF